MEHKTEKQLIQKVRAFAREYGMFAGGGRVAAALSGGADSVCLLLVLAELREEFGFTLCAVHVEHGIRGEESRKDAAFARELCREKRIPLAVYEVDACEWGRRHGLGLEEAARDLRYACFADFCGRLGGARLAAAHHADDNAETLLFHLARGSGVQGLAGMRPVSERSSGVPEDFFQNGIRHSSFEGETIFEEDTSYEGETTFEEDTSYEEETTSKEETTVGTISEGKIREWKGTGLPPMRSALPGEISGGQQSLPERERQAVDSFTVIRPLLCVTKAEILDWLSERGQAYCTDSTNADLTFSRNRIRSSVLPELARVNAQAVSHMNRTALELAGVSDFLEAEARKAEAFCVRRDSGEDPGIHIACQPFGDILPLLQKTMLISLIGEICGGRKDITSQHTAQVLDLFSMRPGKRICLPGGVLAVRTGEEVVLRKRAQKASQTLYRPNPAENGCEVGRADRGNVWFGSFPGDSCAERDVSSAEPGLSVREASDEFSKKGSFFLLTTAAMPETAELEIPGTTLCPGGIRFCTEIFDFDGVFQKIPRNTCTKWFDYDKIKFNVQVRCRKPGDYLEINSTGSHKKLNRYFIDEKLPAEQRDRVLVLADGSHILWVPGMRISEAYKVKEETRRILCVRLLESRSDRPQSGVVLVP